MQGTLFADTRTEAEQAVDGAVAAIVERHAPRGNPIKAKLLRGMIPTLERRIGDLRRDRQENTPKRQREGMSARCEAANLERVVRALEALADGHESGTVPEGLQDLRYRNEIEPLVTKQLDLSGGYYIVRESDKWRDDSPLARELRAYIERSGKGGRSEAQVLADKIKAMEEAVRFVDIPGFFPTPPELVSTMLHWACIHPGERVLEPSAGKGDLAIAAKNAGGLVACLEINHDLTEICKAKGLECGCCDFMAIEAVPVVDKILMNPPFERGMAGEHVRRAFQWLKPGGRLVAVMPANVQHESSNARGRAFQEWLGSQCHQIVTVDPGAFTGREAFKQTGVSVCVVVIDKPHPDFA